MRGQHRSSPLQITCYNMSHLMMCCLPGLLNQRPVKNMKSNPFKASNCFCKIRHSCISIIQLKVNRWFGSRWFGILRDTPLSNTPLSKGVILGIPKTTNRPKPPMLPTTSWTSSTLKTHQPIINPIKKAISIIARKAACFNLKDPRPKLPWLHL